MTYNVFSGTLNPTHSLMIYNGSEFAVYRTITHDIQWKRICCILFILKSYNNTDTPNQNAYFKPSAG